MYPEAPPDLIDVLYPPVDIQVNKMEKEEIVLSLGRFSEDKRQLEQLQVAKGCPSLQFILVGFVGDRDSKRYHERCRRYIKEEALENVTLLTNVDRQTKSDLLARAKFFIHTLRNEPFGLSVAEAIAHGCIPIVHNSGGPAEMIPNSRLRFDDVNGAINSLRKATAGEFDSERLLLDEQKSRFSLENFRSTISLEINALKLRKP